MHTTRRTMLKTAAALGASALLSPALAANLTPTQKPLKIGVIGAGSLGGTVGRLLAQAQFTARLVPQRVAVGGHLGGHHIVLRP